MTLSDRLALATKRPSDYLSRVDVLTRALKGGCMECPSRRSKLGSLRWTASSLPCSGISLLGDSTLSIPPFGGFLDILLVRFSSSLSNDFSVYALV